MFKDIFKRVGIHVLVYLIIFYLIPYVSITFFPENIRDMVTALFLVVFNLLIIITVSTIDSYKYKLNWFLFLIPALLFIPTVKWFYGGLDVLIYSLLYALSYGIGMLLGWAYRTYGYQLKPGYKKIYKEEKAKEIAKSQKEKEKETKKETKKDTTAKKTSTKKKSTKKSK